MRLSSFFAVFVLTLPCALARQNERELRNPEALHHFLASHPGVEWDRIAPALALPSAPGRLILSARRHELQQPGLTLLELSASDGTVHFLRFRGKPATFTDHLEARPVSAGAVPSVTRLGNRSWLRIPADVHIGSGGALIVDRWYDLNRATLSVGFELSLLAHDYRPARLDRAVTTEITTAKDGLRAQILLRITTQFGAIPLTHCTCDAKYTADAEGIRLASGPVDCGPANRMPREDFLALMDFSRPYSQLSLLRLAFPALRARAAKATGAERDWLRLLAQEAPEGPEAEALRALLR